MDIINQSYPIAILIALSLGALSFLSPCVLPIVPPYLAYMSGVRMDEIGDEKSRGKLLINAIYFVLGLSTVFLLLALAVNRLAVNFLANQSLFNTISGVIIILFGLHFLGVLKFGFLERDVRLEARHNTSPIGAYILGLAFAFGWSPCLGPALSAILSLIANEATLSRGIGLMAVYALGLGLPFILSALLMHRFLGAGSALRRHMPKIKIAMGVLLIFVGVMILTGNFTSFAFWLLEQFPWLARIG